MSSRASRRPEIERRLRAGQYPTEVARALGVSRSYTQFIACELGLSFGRGKFNGVARSTLTWTPEMLAELEPFMQGRRGIRTTAAAIGVTPTALIYGVRELALAARALRGAA